MSKIFDALWNGMFLEPMLLGRYPADLVPLFDEITRDATLVHLRHLWGYEVVIDEVAAAD